MVGKMRSNRHCLRVQRHLRQVQQVDKRNDASIDTLDRLPREDAESMPKDATSPARRRGRLGVCRRNRCRLERTKKPSRIYHIPQDEERRLDPVALGKQERICVRGLNSYRRNDSCTHGNEGRSGTRLHMAQEGEEDRAAGVRTALLLSFCFFSSLLLPLCSRAAQPATPIRKAGMTVFSRPLAVAYAAVRRRMGCVEGIYWLGFRPASRRAL